MNEKDFWTWFSANALTIANSLEDQQLVANLDQRIFSTWPRLSWEIGPDPSGGLYFALSPNLNRDYVEEANRAIRRAPLIDNWKFYATRQRKQWDGRFEIEGELQSIKINASNWSYLLLELTDGTREIVLISPIASKLNENERWNAAAIVLESLLGEEIVLNKIDSFNLQTQPEDSFAGKEKPIEFLRQAFGITE